MKKIIFAAAFLSLFLLINPTQAAGLVPCGGAGEKACELCDVFVVINNVIKEALKYAAIIAALMLVIGGVMFFFAGAKPQNVSQATGIITSVIFGLVIAWGSWVIINTALTKLGIVTAPSLLQWYEISCTGGVTQPQGTTEEFPAPPMPPGF